MFKRKLHKASETPEHIENDRGAAKHRPRASHRGSTSSSNGNVGGRRASLSSDFVAGGNAQEVGKNALSSNEGSQDSQVNATAPSSNQPDESFYSSESGQGSEDLNVDAVLNVDATLNVDAAPSAVVASTTDTGTDDAGGNRGNLSSEASPESITASDDNQAALIARFIALYERLMEKQVSFKERVEPFKTCNQNAGKG
ncbi:MAG: hypothetical protein ABJP33_00225 [Pseudoruegeria sp.]